MTEVAEGIDAAVTAEPAAPVEKVPSIAVMPFANLRADKENERFSDGLWSPLAAGLHASPRRPALARKMNLPEAASPG